MSSSSSKQALAITMIVAILFVVSLVTASVAPLQNTLNAGANYFSMASPSSTHTSGGMSSNGQSSLGLLATSYNTFTTGPAGGLQDMYAGETSFSPRLLNILNGSAGTIPYTIGVSVLPDASAVYGGYIFLTGQAVLSSILTPTVFTWTSAAALTQSYTIDTTAALVFANNTGMIEARRERIFWQLDGDGVSNLFYQAPAPTEFNIIPPQIVQIFGTQGLVITANGDPVNVTLSIGQVPLLRTWISVTVQLISPQSRDVFMNGREANLANFTYVWNSTTAVTTQQPWVNITLDVPTWLRQTAGTNVTVSLNITSVIVSTWAQGYYKAPVTNFPFQMYRDPWVPIVDGVPHEIGKLVKLAGTGLNTSSALQSTVLQGGRGVASLAPGNGGIFCPANQTFCLFGDDSDRSIKKLDLTPGSEGNVTYYTPPGSFWSVAWILEIPRGIVPIAGAAATLVTSIRGDADNYNWYILQDKCGIYLMTTPITPINGTTQWALWMGSALATCAGGTSTPDGTAGTIAFVRSDAATFGELPNLLYIVDSWSLAVRQINLFTGAIARYAGAANGYGNSAQTVATVRLSSYFYQPRGICFNGDLVNPVLYVTEQTATPTIGYIRAVSMIGTTGQNSIYAGITTAGPIVDGPFYFGRLGLINSIVCDQANGYMYFTDLTGRVRQWSNVGNVTTLAGNITAGVIGYNGDIPVTQTTGMVRSNTLLNYPTKLAKWRDQLIFIDANNYMIRRIALPIELRSVPVPIIQGTEATLPVTYLTRTCPYNMTLTLSSTRNSLIFPYNTNSLTTISVNISAGSLGPFPSQPTQFLLPFGSPLDASFIVRASGDCVTYGYILPNFTSPFILATTSVITLSNVPTVLTAGDSPNITLNVGSTPLVGTSLSVTVQLAWLGTPQDVNLNNRQTAQSIVYTWDSTTVASTFPTQINFTLNAVSYLRQTGNTYIAAAINVTSVVISNYGLRYYRTPVRQYNFTVYKPAPVTIVPQASELVGQVTTLAGIGTNASFSIQPFATYGPRGYTTFSGQDALFCANDTTYCLYGDIKDGSIKMLDLTDGNEGYISAYTPSNWFYDISWIVQVPRGVIPFGPAATALNVAGDSDAVYYLAGDLCAIWLLKHPSAGSFGRNGTAVQRALWMGVHAQTCGAAAATPDGSIAAGTITFIRSNGATIGENDQLLYIIDTLACAVRLINITAGSVTRYAGVTYGTAGIANGARLTQATFTTLRAIVFNGDRNSIGTTGSAGVPTLYVTDAVLATPNTATIRSIVISTGNVAIVAGGPSLTNYNNGPALTTVVQGAFGLAYDTINNILYWSEVFGGRIRQLRNGQITTLVGPTVGSATGSAGYNGDFTQGNLTLLNQPNQMVKWRDYLIFIDTQNNIVRRVALPIEINPYGLFSFVQGSTTNLPAVQLTRVCPYPVTLALSSTLTRIFFTTGQGFQTTYTDPVPIAAGTLGSFPSSTLPFILPGGLDSTATTFTIVASGACVDNGFMLPNQYSPWTTNVLPVITITGAPTYMTPGSRVNISLNVQSVPISLNQLRVVVSLTGEPTHGDINLNQQPATAELLFFWDSSIQVSTLPVSQNVSVYVYPWLRMNANTSIPVSLNIWSVTTTNYNWYRAPVRAYPFTVYKPSLPALGTSDALGTVTTLAGTGVNVAVTSIEVQHMPATGVRGTASLGYVSGLFCSSSAFCLYGDTTDQSIRKMDMSSGNEGTISSFTATGSFPLAQWIVQPAVGVKPYGSNVTTGQYYLVGGRCGIWTVNSVTSQPILWMGQATAACSLNDVKDGSVNGTSGTIRFGNPRAAVIGESPEILYIADSVSYTIRRVNIATGVITRFAGGASAGYSLTGSGYANGDRLTSALFSAIKGIAFNGDSVNPVLYVTDDQYIRAIDIKTGIVSTYAGGLAESGSAADGTVAAVRLYQPQGIIYDTANAIIYFTEVVGGRVRKITNGIVTTLAGSMSQQQGYNGDGAGLSTLFNSLDQLAKYGDQLIVADVRNFMIRRVVIPISLA